MNATEAILRKALVGSDLDTAGWARVDAGLRDRAFFSSQIQSAEVLHGMRSEIAKILHDGKSMSEVRRDIREMLDRTGYDPGDDNRGTIKDLYSRQRLDVMIKTNVRQARGYAKHLSSTTPAALLAYPCYEFVRVLHRRVPRSNWPQRWAKAANAVGFKGVARGTTRMIALKTSPIWTTLNVFGNPFPPFDFNSGMGLISVNAATCKEVGLAEEAKSQTPPDVEMNGSLQAETRIPDDSREADALRAAFGDQVTIENGIARWNPYDPTKTFTTAGVTVTPEGVEGLPPELLALVPALMRTKPQNGVRTLEAITGAIMMLMNGKVSLA